MKIDISKVRDRIDNYYKTIHDSLNPEKINQRKLDQVSKYIERQKMKDLITVQEFNFLLNKLNLAEDDKNLSEIKINLSTEMINDLSKLGV